jgi:hypothetical protein
VGKSEGPEQFVHGDDRIDRLRALVHPGAGLLI